MSKRYTQLTEAERYHIYTMKKQGYTDTVIAQGMGRDRTTIWREPHRNTGQRGYRHQQAQQWAVARHRAKPKRLNYVHDWIMNSTPCTKQTKNQAGLE